MQLSVTLSKVVRCSMQFPNKLYPYQKSTLALIPKVLHEIKNGNNDIIELYHSVTQDLEDPTDFLSVMDCLYALNAIEMTEEGEITICFRNLLACF